MLAPRDGTKAAQPLAVTLDVAVDQPLELAHHSVIVGRNLAAGLDVQQIEAGIAALVEDLDLAELAVLARAGELASQSVQLDAGLTGAAGQGQGLAQAQAHVIEVWVEADEHRAQLLGGHLEQAVATKLEHRRDLVGHARVVASRRDAARVRGLRDVEAELDVEQQRLGADALVLEHADDAVDAQVVDEDAIAGHRAARVPACSSSAHLLSSAPKSSSMTGEEELLLAAIQAAPDDDAPRLVHADWLQRRGDVRGEFIATQCMLAAMDDERDDEARADLQARQWEIYDEHAAAWLAEVGLELGEGEFHRGFVEEVRVPFSRLNLEQLGRRAVVRQLWIIPRADGAAPPGFRKLLEWPGLELLRDLSLAESRLGVENIGLLVQSPRLCNLRRLDLRDNLAWTKAIEMIAGSPILAKLVSLDLGDNYLYDDSVRLLADSPHLAGLRELGLEKNRLQTAADLVRARFSDRLESLDLRKNSLTEEARAELRRQFGKRVRL